VNEVERDPGDSSGHPAWPRAGGTAGEAPPDDDPASDWASESSTRWAWGSPTFVPFAPVLKHLALLPALAGHPFLVDAACARPLTRGSSSDRGAHLPRHGSQGVLGLPARARLRPPSAGSPSRTSAAVVGALALLARRLSVRPTAALRARLLVRCPGSGPSRSLVRLGLDRGAPAFPRISARLPEPVAGGEKAVALGGLLADKRRIAVTSSVVCSMLKGQGPHQVPPGSTLAPRLMPGARGGQSLRGVEKTRSLAPRTGDRAGTGTTPRSSASRRRGEDVEETGSVIAGEGDRKRVSARTGSCPEEHPLRTRSSPESRARGWSSP